MSNAQQILTSSRDSVIGTLRRQGHVRRAARYLRRHGRRLAVASALLAGDIAAGWLAILVGSALLNVLIPGAVGGASPGPSVLLLVLIFVAVGVYAGQCPYARFRQRGVGILLLIGAYCAARVETVPLHLLAIEALVYSALMLVFGFFAERAQRRLLISSGLWMAPTVIVGDDAAARRLHATFLAQPDLGFRPIGFAVASPADARQSDTLPGPIVASIDNLSALEAAAEVAVLTSRDQVPLVNQSAGRAKLQYIILNAASDMPTLWLRFRPMGSDVGIQVERDPYLSQNHILKRAMDLAIAVPFAILVLPLVGLLALLIWMVDPGSPFYAQPRVGRGGRTFNVPKLRTMYRDAPQRLAEYLQADPAAKEEWQRYFKLRNDPRVLPFIGAFLRRASLDELPQLWSVIVGDMSLVGPRPFPAYHLNSFSADFQRARYSVPPGLTGLWQVTARSNGDIHVQETQDTFYIRNWSVWLDLYILLMTVPALLSGNGAR